VVHGADLTGLPVGVVDPAGQADRVVAVAGLSDQLGPPLIAVAGRSMTSPRTPGSSSPTRIGSVMPPYLACGRRRRWGWSLVRISRVESR
jgi:hypothetical protein